MTDPAAFRAGFPSTAGSKVLRVPGPSRLVSQVVMPAGTVVSRLALGLTVRDGFRLVDRCDFLHRR